MRASSDIKSEIADWEARRRTFERDLADRRKQDVSTASAESDLKWCDGALRDLRAELQQRHDNDEREARGRKAAEEHAHALLKPEKPLAEAQRALEPFAETLEESRKVERVAEKKLAECEADLSRLNGRRAEALQRKAELSGEARKSLLHQIASLNLEADDAIEQRDAAKKALEVPRAIVATALAAYRRAEADVMFWSAAVHSNRARQKVLAFLADIAPDVIEVSKLAREARERGQGRADALFGAGALAKLFPAAAALPEARDFSNSIISANSQDEIQGIVERLRASVQHTPRKAGAK